jgi:hypothetical protein
MVACPGDIVDGGWFSGIVVAEYSELNAHPYQPVRILEVFTGDASIPVGHRSFQGWMKSILAGRRGNRFMRRTMDGWHEGWPGLISHTLLVASDDVTVTLKQGALFLQTI